MHLPRTAAAEAGVVIHGVLRTTTPNVRTRCTACDNAITYYTLIQCMSSTVACRLLVSLLSALGGWVKAIVSDCHPHLKDNVAHLSADKQLLHR